jgi:hypothetical protein
MNSKQVQSIKPTLSEIYKYFAPFPSEAVLFGVCQDESPFLFSVDNIVYESPNVMIWGKIIGQGIRVIKTSVEFILRYKNQKRDRTEVVIISNNVKEWERLQNSDLGVGKTKECVAVVPFWHGITEQIIVSLNQWIEQREAKNPLVLFIDGFEGVLEMSEKSTESLASLMVNGRRKNIYVIGTAKIESRPILREWMNKFQEEIFGADILEFFETKDGLVFWTPETEI